MNDFEKIASPAYPEHVERVGWLDGQRYWKVTPFNVCQGCMFNDADEPWAMGHSNGCRKLRQTVSCMNVIVIRPEHYDGYLIKRVTHALVGRTDKA